MTVDVYLVKFNKNMEGKKISEINKTFYLQQQPATFLCHLEDIILKVPEEEGSGIWRLSLLWYFPSLPQSQISRKLEDYKLQPSQVSFQVFHLRHCRKRLMSKALKSRQLQSQWQVVVIVCRLGRDFKVQTCLPSFLPDIIK